MSSQTITDQMSPTTQVQLEPDFAAAPETVKSLTQPGDVVFTMGAGTVTQLGEEILAALQQ